ncbi:bifunctional phosphoribosylaminoimidazole carboxylase/phosphoribosylaminoimidazole succinocarboxamide synthetase [Cyrtonyx montezumae]|uniref:bifunctional phosphoribosylaminoimidazole carboxylase/phosphoribosylaminoimidazole succinocarboxamide synthetase n=1 Tax=Cyrtonyx montezumae TaxID=9017 RepID=UPI0032DABE27
MESGAGKHWTEEEVKALLSIWSEKSIRKQLHGTLRNKGIFIYIAKRLQELGVCRDWKQCRAKYKNLKYEYRTVKYARNSGDATKTMKFFHDLDAILRCEPVARLAAEGNSRCSASASEVQLNASPNADSSQGELSVSLEDDEDAPGDPLLFMSHVRPVQLGNLPPALEASKTSAFIPTVANEGGKHWTVNEVRALIHIWSDKNIQQQLEGTVRNKRIFEQVAARLQKFGIDRDWKQCRTKYKNLKHEYKSIKNGQDSGSTSRSMKFFNELDAILGHGTMEQASKSDNEESERPPEWTEAKSGKDSTEIPGDTGEEDSVSNLSEDLQVAVTKKVSDPETFEDEEDFSNSTLAALEATQIKKEMIDIEDDSISSTSEDRSCTPLAKQIVNTDNHIPLEEAQNHFKVITVNDTGTGKHWSDNEVRALINIWSDEKIQQMLEGATRNKEIFEEIARRLMKRGIDRDWKQCRTKYKNLKYEYRALQKENEHLGNPRRKMRFYDEVDCILRRQPLGPSSWGCESSSLLSVSVGDVTTNTGSLGIKRKAWTDEMSPIPLKKSASENTIFQFQKLLTERVNTVTEGKKLLLERLCKQEEVQDLNRTQLYAHPSAMQQVGLMNFLPNYVNLPPLSKNYHAGSYIKAEQMQQLSTPKGSHPPLPAVVRTRASHTTPGTARQGRAGQQVAVLPGRGASPPPSRAHRGRAERTDGPGRRRFVRCGLSVKRARELLPRAQGGCPADAGRAGPRPHRSPLRRRRDVPGPALTSFPLSVPPVRPRPAYLCCSPTSPRVITWGTSSSVGHTPEAMQPNTPHSSRMPSSSSSMAARGGVARPDPLRWIPPARSCGRRAQPTAPRRAGPPVPVAAAAAAAMAPAASELKLGKKVNEGKTKEVYELPDIPGCVLMQSKDQITAGNAARKDRMEGKAAISNTTTSCVFQLLQEAGIKTAFVRKQSDTAFIAAHCEMIPIEWVCRRIATGSFLKRNPGVKEGYKFYPPKIEMFYKDDANNDPQWSEEQLVEAKFCFAGLTIGKTEVDIMARSTQAIFEILEKSWQPQNCTLVDLKIEFGVNILTKEIVLADVIDNDSWRLWPSGDRSQQKDKQSYRDLKEVTPEALQMVKRNFEWVAERVELLLKTKSQGRVVVLMGSTSDLGHCEKIKKACATFGIPCELRVTSAHKGPDETLRIKAEYEGDGIPTVFVAVAGRSNGLGPVMSGNTVYPVVNCPPLSADWGAQDVWSSLRLPSGLGCPTTLSPEGAAQFAAQIFGLNNHLVWAKLRSNMLNTWISLKQADKKLRECTL